MHLKTTVAWHAVAILHAYAQVQWHGADPAALACLAPEQGYTQHSHKGQIAETVPTLPIAARLVRDHTKAPGLSPPSRAAIAAPPEPDGGKIEWSRNGPETVGQSRPCSGHRAVIVTTAITQRLRADSSTVRIQPCVTYILYSQASMMHVCSCVH